LKATVTRDLSVTEVLHDVPDHLTGSDTRILSI